MSHVRGDGSRTTLRAVFVVACFMVALVPRLRAQHAPQQLAPTRWSTALPVVAPVDSVAAVLPPDMQERYTKRGAIIGAALGAAGGLGFGVLLALFCEAEGDGCWGIPPLLGLAGALGGGLVGGILGAAVPREDGAVPERREPRDEPREPPADTLRERTPYEEVFAPPPRTGSLALAAGYADADIAGTREGAGPAARLHVAAEIGSWLSIGLEGGQSFLGDAGNVRHGAVTLRATLPRRRVSPYVNGNLGYYQMTEPSLEFFGGSLGVGARILPGDYSRWFIDVEARHSRNLQNIEPLRMNALLAGIGWYW